MSDDDGLEFFNGLSGRLEVKLTEPATPVAPHLMNLAAPASATIASVGLTMEVYANEEFRELTADEWNRVVLREPTIRMRGEAELVVDHTAPPSGAFTVRDLATAVAETERQGRGSSEWLGGIDVHHVFFEGIEEDDDGVWQISWGS